MTVIFNDTFTGSGALTAHTPDTPWSGQAWSDWGGMASMSVSGGKLVNDTTSVGQIGQYQYGDAIAGNGTSQFTGTLNFTTGTDVTTFTGSRVLLALGIISGDTNVDFVLSEVGGVWCVNGGGISLPVSIKASTAYALTFFCADGFWYFLGFGQSASGGGTAYTTPATGVQWIKLELGDACSIDSLVLNTDATTNRRVAGSMLLPLPVVDAGQAPPSVCAVTAPMFTLAVTAHFGLPPVHYFRDDFTGTGTIVGTHPTVAASPTDTWYDFYSGSTKSGGFVVASTTLGGGPRIDLTDTIGPRGSAMGFTLKTPASLTPYFADVGAEVWRVGASISDGSATDYFAVTVNNISGTSYNVGLEVNSSTATRQTVTLAPSTTYTGFIIFSDGAQTVTFLGKTLTRTEAFTSVAGTGLTQIDSHLTGTFFQLGPLFVDYIRASFDITLPHLTLSAAGTGPVASAGANMNLPMMTMTAYGGGGAAGTLPMVRIASASGGGIWGILPMPTAWIVAHASYGDNAVIARLPMLALAGFAGGTATGTFPLPMLGVTGTIWGLGAVAGTLPALQGSATGTVPSSARGAETLPMFAMVGYSGAVISVALSGYTFAATGTAGGLAGVAATLPMFDLTAAGTAQAHGSAELLLPMLTSPGHAQAWLVLPGLTLTAVGTATITATYEAYALNLHHAPGRPGEPVVDEMTRYTNFPFTHVVRYKNSYYGVASGALYLLEGVTDDTAPVAYDIKTAKTDFGTTEKKTILSAYFGGRLGAAETVTLVVGEAGTETYSYTTPRGPLAQSYRQVFGRGVKSRYFGLEVSGSDTFELDTIDLNVEQLTRRI